MPVDDNTARLHPYPRVVQLQLLDDWLSSNGSQNRIAGQGASII